MPNARPCFQWRTYLFAVPFLLPLFMGEAGIWTALPVADLMLVLTAVVILSRRGAGLRRRPFVAA